MFALTLAPLVFATGAAVDLSRAVRERTMVMQAFDAAGLAAARMATTDAAVVEQMAEDFLRANLPGVTYSHIQGLTITQPDQRVVVEGTVSVGTTFLAAMGVNAIDLPVRTEIVRRARSIELALVLDNTGSMAGSGKIAALREAAEDMVNKLFADDDADDHVRVAIVPYVTAVNVRGEGFDWDWIDEDGLAEHNGANFTPPTSHLDLFDDMGVAWKGCVEMRAEPYDLTDEPPGADPDTLWVPYLWPDEPEDGGSGADFHNDYIYDDEDHCAACAGLSGEELHIAQQADITKYSAVADVDEVDEEPSNTAGPNKSCARPIMPLTNDHQGLVDEIRAMEPWNASGTNGAAGLVWGWRVLSPGQPYDQGVSYDDADVQKAMVMMTDGENVIWGGWDSPNASNYSAYGYLSQDRLGTDDKNTAKSRINDRMAEACESIKDEGILMFTVTFRLNSEALKDVFRDCASKPEWYFDSGSNDAIVDHFLAIAGELSDLRIAG